MNQTIDRDLQILTEISSGEQVTQRRLAKTLGIALGLTNLLLRRLVKKGYVKMLGTQRNRLRYLVTPGGIAEKARLTYEYLEYSLNFYQRIRTLITQALERLPSECRTLVLYGTGEIAEIVYLVIQSFGLRVVGVSEAVNPRATPKIFLNFQVQPLSDFEPQNYDRIVVASLTHREATRALLVAQGIPPEKIIMIPDATALFPHRTPEAAVRPGAVDESRGGEQPLDTSIVREANAQ